MSTSNRQRRASLLSPPSSVLDAVGLGGLIGGLDRETLQDIRDVLNGGKGPELGADLKRLVEQWQASGPNLELFVSGSKAAEPHSNDPFPIDTWSAINEICHSQWIPTASGNARLWFAFDPKRVKALSCQGEVGERKAKAVALFALLTLNPEWDKLAGPCARCRSYYIKKRASQKVYCSRKCGNAATAIVRTKERSGNEHKDKLNRAKAAIREWTTARTKDEWKVFVSNREGLTPKFLTRAVNKGELKAPVRRQRAGGIR